MRLTSTNYMYHLQKVLNESLDGMEKRLKSKQKVYKHMDINVMIFLDILILFSFPSQKVLNDSMDALERRLISKLETLKETADK